jgi:hypothetical protein
VSQVLSGQMPTRSDIAEKWRELIEGQLSRQAVHEWAAPWVEEWDHLVEDMGVRQGLLYLHGFDLIYVAQERNIVRHGGVGRHVHDMQHIISKFDEWRSRWGIETD